MNQQSTILIVDDEPRGLKTLRALLIGEGYELVLASNGHEALEKMAEVNPDVILLDVMMPGMDGFEVCQRLKSTEQWQHIPIILATALDSKSDVAAGLEAGADDFLSKPIDKLELRARVRSMLRIKSQYDDLAEQQEQLTASLDLNRQFAQAVAIHAEQLELLHDLGVQLMNNLNTDSVLSLISKTALELIPGATGCVMHFTTGKEDFLLPVVFSNESETKLVESTPGIEQIVRQAISCQETTYISDLMANPIYPQPDNMRTLLVVPTINSQSSLGTISVYSPKIDAFTETQAHLLLILTSQAEAAITRAHSFEERERISKEEKYAVQDMFQRYVSPTVVNRLVNGQGTLTLGGRRQEITILFADMRGFTSFSETMPPEQLVKILNHYLPLAVEAIMEQEGTLDKIMGDAVMAIFNAPLLQPDHTLRAIRAALAIQRAVATYNEQTTEHAHLSFGLGVHMGQAVVGNIGTAQHMNYTAIGDTINLAWRLQEHSKGGQIILSHAAYTTVKDVAIAEELGAITVKGRTASEPIYALTDLLEPITH